MARELIPRPLPTKAQLHLAYEDNAKLRARIAALEAQLAEAKRENEALREALRGMFCPRPCNHRPNDFDVGPCFDAGECGCIAGVALARNAGGKDAE